tara:strand:- start:585 stop:1004 length:420 start_codon:yes stop_codon:yes gene_type:complete
MSIKATFCRPHGESKVNDATDLVPGLQREPLVDLEAESLSQPIGNPLIQPASRSHKSLDGGYHSFLVGFSNTLEQRTHTPIEGRMEVRSKLSNRRSTSIAMTVDDIPIEELAPTTLLLSERGKGCLHSGITGINGGGRA